MADLRRRDLPGWNESIRIFFFLRSSDARSLFLSSLFHAALVATLETKKITQLRCLLRLKNTCVIAVIENESIMPFPFSLLFKNAGDF